MIEVDKNLYVGSQADLEKLPERGTWAICHAAKEPFHREALGYKTAGAPKTDAEYLFARRGNRLCLNLVDVDDPAYVSPVLMKAAIAFIAEHVKARRVLVHCNQGASRGPGVAMAYMAPELPANFDDAERAFRQLYPSYLPKNGMRMYLMNNWHILSKT